MKRRNHLFIRKAHRYLGLLTGIQFILWTAGGLYFSWSNIDEIHGDYQKKAPSSFEASLNLVAPTQVFSQLPQADSLKSVKLIDVLGKPAYQILYFANQHGKPKLHTQLAWAGNGELRAPLTEQEAELMALQSFNEPVHVIKTEYLTEENVGRHHEYRESPLPAFAVTMEHPSNTTVYVATERGEVTKFRNNKWRAFDFLWMLHTMDYEGRDNFGNLLLRLFSVIGMITILSGFALYFISFRRNNRKLIKNPTPRPAALR
ncbi:PepSY domain-containing protein [Pontibacter oryzae]|uniref:PepSY domain-containing protein n=1 Tax=Pontibacter oryzae TaxID=2304593 RepID=A0A399RRL6_9BACT|nr:PepSY domain-containing protein [Pontibacter oryzae]RIJ33441.1 hypothetical protein D1627_17640 [Pontibacter oryzae]